MEKQSNRVKAESEQKIAENVDEIIPLEPEILSLVGGGDEGSGVITIPK